MAKLKILFFAFIFFSLQTVYSGGETDSKAPQQQTRPPGAQAHFFADSAWNTMDSAFAQQNATPEDEYYLGRAVAANILSAYRPYTANHELTAYLNSICQTIAINSSNPVIFGGYHVLVLDSHEFNAFATPGGHIFITRGLVEAASSEDMLAALIAHEMAHIMLKHGMRLIDDMFIFNQASQAASQGQLLSGSSSANKLMEFRNSVASVSDTLIKNGYSQAYEFEADREALKLLASAGYDPSALVEMLRILQRVQTSQRGGFNTSHPAPAARISNVESVLRNYTVQDTKSYRVPRFKNK